MGSNLITLSEGLSPEIAPENPEITPGNAKPRTRWLLVAAQLLALLTYASGLAFLIKTTAGTLVLFSLLAPAMVIAVVVALVVVAISEFRRRHGVSRFHVYDTGEIIFRQGELGDCAYFIQSGEVEVLRYENGSENVIAKLCEGEYFGERALITSAPRSTTTRAATQTRVGIIRKRSFLTMVIVMPIKYGDFRSKKRLGGHITKYTS